MSTLSEAVELSRDTSEQLQPNLRESRSVVGDPVLAIEPDEVFDGSWPFAARYNRSPGFPMHYVDEGDGAETLLLLHGEPTWSYLFRKQIVHWSQTARVVAVDHMGFGKSATPAGRSYWLQDHIDNLERFVLSLELRDLTLVMHDFGGPVGMGLAVRHPDRIKRIVSVNGPTPLGQPDLLDRLTANASTAPWFQWIAKAADDGTLEAILGQLDYTILSTLKLNGFERNAVISDTWLSAYRAPFPTPEQAAGAIGWARGFAMGAHRFETPDAAVKAELAGKPALALWGAADRTLQPEQFLPLFRQAFPNGLIEVLDGAGHYSPEDAPEVIAEAVSRFLTKN